MTSDAIQLLRDHWSEVPEADEETVREAYAYAVRPRRVRHRLIPTLALARPRVAAAVLVGVAILAAAGVGVNALLQTSQPTQSSTQAEPGAVRDTLVIGTNPCEQRGEASEILTLEQLKATKSYPIAIPDSPLANSENVGSVWLCTQTGLAAAYWPSSGIEVIWGGTGVDYTGSPAKDIQTINGVRVILEPAPQGENTRLLFPEPDGHTVTLVTKGSINDLIAVAQTLPVH